MNYFFFNKQKLTKLSFCLLITAISLFTFADVIAAVKQFTADKNVLQIVEGRWLRSDGRYFIEFKALGEDGKFTAVYYNPSPINVSQAELRKDSEGKLNVMVELRDINYPGSKYELKYDTETSRLVGTYFQAVDKITYKVNFLKK